MQETTHAVERGSEYPLADRCAARLAHTDPVRYCTQRPLNGARRCKWHGGASKGNTNYAGTRGKGWERALGPTWRATKNAPVRDLDINTRVFLSRETELRERLGEGDSGRFRATAVELIVEVRTRARAGDGEGLSRALASLETHLTEGRDRDGVWADILAIEERHARMVETATKIETAASNCLTARALAGLLGTIFDLVMEEAGEHAAYRVGRRFDRIIAADLPNGSAFQEIPALAPHCEEGSAEVPE